MRITLKPLSAAELRLALEILNVGTDRKALTGPLADLEKKGAEYSARTALKKIDGSVWRNGDDMAPALLKSQWRDAQEILEKAVVTGRELKGFFLHLPAIGLPMKTPAALICTPNDLALWLLSRGVANRQHLRLVKCARQKCGKFGLRDRAREGSKYCSTECQFRANADRAEGQSRVNRAAKEPDKLTELRPR